MFFIPVLTMRAAGPAVTDARGVAALRVGALGVAFGGATLGAGLAMEFRATESGFVDAATVGAGRRKQRVGTICGRMTLAATVATLG